MYFWGASGIRLTPINIYINDLEVNIKSLQLKFVNDRKTGRVASIDEDTAFIQSDLNHLTNYFNISRGRMKFISLVSASSCSSFCRQPRL